MLATETISRIKVQDSAKQKLEEVKELPVDFLVRNLVDSMVAHWNLPERDPNGRIQIWQAKLEREGRRLYDTERIGDAVQPDDMITLQPNVDAGV